MKAVEDMERGWWGVCDDAQIGPPEVRANEAHLLAARSSEAMKNRFQAVSCAVLADVSCIRPVKFRCCSNGFGDPIWIDHIIPETIDGA
ncbi:MAG: hypothetical protein WAM53_14735 [Terrimicrobiaceae bacterium]